MKILGGMRNFFISFKSYLYKILIKINSAEESDSEESDSVPLDQDRGRK